MADILLIQPPIRDFYLTAKRTIPYGLACLGGSLRDTGLQVEILDALATRRTRPAPLPAEMAPLEVYYGRPDRSPFSLFHGYTHYGMSETAIARHAGESGAWLVGISSLFTPYADMAIRCAEIVRKALPRSIVVLGGHHPTVFPQRVMASPAVDYVLRGEGEVSLAALAAALRNGTPVSDIAGAVWRDAGGGLMIRPPAVMDRLDRFAPPDLSLINQRYYCRGGRGAAVVVASRGCPLSCSYCCMGDETAPPYRRRSVESVLSEIEEAVYRHGAGFVDFEDENISLDRRWFLDLLQGVVSRFGPRVIELRAMNGLLPSSLDRQVVDRMQQAGFDTLNLSLGASNDEQLRRFRRPDLRTAFDHALGLAETFGLGAVGYVIAGAPFQRPRDSLADLLYLAQRRVLAGLSIYYPAPPSHDYALCEKLGLLPQSPRLMRSSALPISHTTSRLEAVTLMRLARILNFIKSLVDADEGLPRPAPLPANIALQGRERIEIGRKLLASFLHDGRIPGIDGDGEIFEHVVSLDLTRRFVDGLKRIRIRGATR